MANKSVGYVATGYNEFDGAFRLGGDTAINNGTFVELDDATGVATLVGADPTGAVYFVCQENTNAPERTASDFEIDIVPGDLLKLFNMETGKHIITSEVDAEMNVGDKAYPANGVLTSTKPAGATKELIVREVINYGDIVAYRLEILA